MRSLSVVISTRPSEAISCRVIPPGTARILRFFPLRSTPHKERMELLLAAAVNQISFPVGSNPARLRIPSPRQGSHVARQVGYANRTAIIPGAG